MSPKRALKKWNTGKCFISVFKKSRVWILSMRDKTNAVLGYHLLAEMGKVVEQEKRKRDRIQIFPANHVERLFKY